MKQTLLASLLFAAACGGRAAAPAEIPVAAAATPAARAPTCPPPIDGAAALLQPGALILFGEVHGTAEIPAFVGRVACEATAHAREVVVGLEIVRDEQPRLDAYVASDGGAAARAALLAGDFWRRADQDGRSSQGILGLVEAVRGLRAGGAAVRLVAYDANKADFAPHTADRDELMARHILDARAASPDAVLIVLTGNIHARIAEGAPWDPKYVPMGASLIKTVPSLVALNVSSEPGTAWVCMGDSPTTQTCGSHPWGKAAAGPVAIVRDTADERYHGRFHVGATSAAPPAAP